MGLLRSWGIIVFLVFMFLSPWSFYCFFNLLLTYFPINSLETIVRRKLGKINIF